MKYMLKTVDYLETLNYTIVAFMVLISVLFSCAENSDNLVKDTKAVKQFDIEAHNHKDLAINTDLIEQVILIEGIVEDINGLNQRNTVILKGEDTKRFVICDMQKSENLALLNVGDTVTIKGILKGTLKDVILLNCIIPIHNE